MNEEKLIQQRKENILKFFKNKQAWIIGVLIVAIILGAYIRSLPMQDHNPNLPGNQPGLWDITTNTWTLGPDLDPWLFTRYAKTIVETGGLPENDVFRYVPLGFNPQTELQMVSYAIVWIYNLVNIFGDYNLEFAAVFMPVLLFLLTIVSFFFFVREVFIRKEKESILKANLIAIISTFFMIVIPVFLSRTIAGIPEKESVAFFFMFLAFYLFLKSWKSEKIKSSIIYSGLAGIATGVMALTWGGVTYVYVTIGVASLIGFILGKIKKKESLSIFTWFIVSMTIFLGFSQRANLIDTLTSTTNLILTFTLFVIIVHYILWKTKVSKFEFMRKFENKIPKTIISVVFALVFGAIIVSTFFGIDFISNKISGLIQTFIKPVTGRWNVTVAENRQPYFSEWAATLGPFIKNIPVMFWLFFIGSIVLFKEMLNKIKKKDAWVLTGLYFLFLIGLIFSRYAPHPALLDGEGFISKVFYFGSALLLIGGLVYYYIKYHEEKELLFEKIDFEYLFLFSLLVLTLFTARSAVRLIMVLGPIAPIFASYLSIKLIFDFKKIKDELGKVLLVIGIILIVLLMLFSFYSFYKEVKVQSYSMVPSYYNQQWQKAMSWVRNETPVDSVFAHWWDYGYWIQSIGNRATVLDGGNGITYWNYLMGRFVLTGDNQKDALEFLYNHNATHLLIDSSDIGKYGAFASIGSDENYDRYSWIGTFLLDEKQTQETNNQTVLVYSGGVALDEDLLINQNGKSILLPGQKAGVGAIVLPFSKEGNETKAAQPYIVVVYNGQQYKVNLRYLASEGEFVDFGSGIESAIYLFPTLSNSNSQILSNPVGAAMFLSPRLMRGMLVQKYILDDPFKKFTNFELAHSEENLIIEELNMQGMDLPEFIYFQGVQGPIKIWEIKYSGNEQIKKEYLDTDPTKYLSWQL